MERKFVKTEINKFHLKYVNSLDRNEEQALLVFYNGGIDIRYNNWPESILASQVQILPNGVIHHVYHCRLVLSIDSRGRYVIGKSPSAKLST